MNDNIPRRTKVDSIVIVANAHGYTAHLRFTDPIFDEDIAAASSWAIHARIERIVYQKCGREFWA